MGVNTLGERASYMKLGGGGIVGRNRTTEASTSDVSLINVNVLQLVAQVIWDGGFVGFTFLEYLLSRLVKHLTQVTVPFRARLRREHDCL